MANNQTIDGVPREKLRDVLNRMRQDQVSLGAYGDELRALLDAPTVERKPYAYAHEWAGWISTEGPKDFKAVIEREAPPQWAVESGQARNVIPLYDVPAAQPQGGVTHWANPDHVETITAEMKAHNLSLGGAPAAAVARYTIALGPVIQAHGEPVGFLHKHFREAQDRQLGTITWIEEGLSCIPVYLGTPVQAAEAESHDE